jgi:threonyl-tRNA synthetase
MKTPYWVVIGDAEMNNKTVTVEHITKGKLGEMSLDDFMKQTILEVEEKQ